MGNVGTGYDLSEIAPFRSRQAGDHGGVLDDGCGIALCQTEPHEKSSVPAHQVLLCDWPWPVPIMRANVWARSADVSRHSRQLHTGHLRL